MHASLFLVLSGILAPASEAPLHHVGVARKDITPDFPVRLSGFGFRRTESEGVYQKIWAKAIAIGETDPAILLCVDNLGVSAALGDQLAKRLESSQVKPHRLVLCATHTHTAPMLSGVCPTLFGLPIPADHQKQVERYTAFFLDQLEAVVKAALADRQPALLGWGKGYSSLAKNRRTNGGPVDQELLVLTVRNPRGDLRGILVNYACHAVTLSHNKVGGDWPGFAQQAIEDAFPGAICLVAIGCGADSNPSSGVTGDKVDIASRQGLAMAREVKTVLSGPMAPLTGPLTIRSETIPLALSPLPDRKTWEERARKTDAIGHHARVQLAKIDAGKSLETSIPYRITTWLFGDSLGMVFLPGEVVVDYSLRLKKELDRHRIWITAYANDAPCYIPSERILKEGGYEGGGAMVYYDVPVPFAPGLENQIIGLVRKLVGKPFESTVQAETPNPGALSTAESLARLQTRPGLKIEQVVTEPMVTSPVAIDFGPDGKIWVAEMLDYPTGSRGNYEPGGRIRLLDEMDDQYRPRRSRIFLEGIPFPTGVTAWRKGVLICAAPDILYAEDTNGDGKADKVEKLFSNFGTENFQARVNGLIPGLDGWVHGSCGLFGGQILSHKTGKIIKLGDRDFRIKPDTGEMEPATGRTQQGRVRDDWGNWFGCDNSTLATHLVLPADALKRNLEAAYPRTVQAIATSPEVTRLSPITSPQMFKLSGPPNSVTAACGIGVYRDTLLGPQFQGDLFTCEPVNLLVHRMKLRLAGPTFEATRPPGEENQAFLASSDLWFRPVQMRTGPDGAIWVVDMHRQVIEHPRWIPVDDLSRLDVRAGSQLGRIYRILPQNAAPRMVARLDQLDPDSLVAAMDTPNGTTRDAAMSLILWTEPGQQQTHVPLLRKLVESSSHPEARVQALATLALIQGKAPLDLTQLALKDSQPGLKKLGARLASDHLEGPGIIKSLVGLAWDAHPGVRLEAILSLGNARGGEAARAFADLLAQADLDPYLEEAIHSGLNQQTLKETLAALSSNARVNPSRLTPLWAMASARGEETTLRKALEQALAQPNPSHRIVADLLEQPALAKRDRNDSTLKPSLEKVLAKAEEIAVNPGADPEARTQAIRLLSHGGDTKKVATLLGALLGPRNPPVIQTAAIEQLSRWGGSEGVRVILDQMANLTPTARQTAILRLLGRKETIQLVLDRLESKSIQPTLFDAAQRQQLLTHKDPTIAQRAAKVLDASRFSNRNQVIETYAKALHGTGSAVRGKEHFQKACSVCHKLSGAGHEVGPDLAMIANKSPGWMLQEILDPSRNLDSRYSQFVIATRQGQTYSGLLAEETPTSITLKMQEGRSQVLLRSEIEEMTATGKSLMPEGLEKDLDPRAMADLIAYLGSQIPPPKSMPGNRPETITLGPKHTKLAASQAAIYGGDIVFESEFGNIGCWHSERDHAVWNLESPKTVKWDIWIDFACAPEVAGNRYTVEVGESKIQAKVEPTRGWSSYRLLMIGDLTIPAGSSRLVFRPEGPVNGALIDLRAIHIIEYDEVPVGPEVEKTPAVPFDAAAIARVLLDPKEKADRKSSLIRQHLEKGADLIKEMTRDMPNDPKEEYRRIPVIWQVAIAAGKSNQVEVMRSILEVSLPQVSGEMRDWQAVVVGGGLINGITQAGAWPIDRMKELVAGNTSLESRYRHSLELASVMADNPKVADGTRYDALRMIAMEGFAKRGSQLSKYLARGGNDELAMGAVSGLADIPAPEVIPLLLEALGHLNVENRELAVAGLVRDASRSLALLEALATGKAKKEWLKPGQIEALKNHSDPRVKQKAVKVLGG